MFCLRCTPELRERIETASKISGLTVSKILRNTAIWFNNCRIELIQHGANITVDKRQNIVIKVPLTGIYYGKQTEIITADLRGVVPPAPRDFRKALAAATKMIIDDAAMRSERQRRLDAMGKEGVDFNVPDSVLERREVYGIVWEHRRENGTPAQS